LLPESIVEELLSLAHVQAIAAVAGISISNFDRDFGADGTFRQITTLGNRRYVSGYALDFQLKASTRCQIESESIVYDLEVKAYNDLVNRQQAIGSTPIVLILKVLPYNRNDWLCASEDSLLLSGGCYWSYLQGQPSENRSAVRIRIPRSQSLNPESLSMLLRCVQNGILPC
jgi:Domain of unknown function (DUF4365)